MSPLLGRLEQSHPAYFTRNKSLIISVVFVHPYCAHDASVMHWQKNNLRRLKAIFSTFQLLYFDGSVPQIIIKNRDYFLDVTGYHSNDITC